MFLISIVIFVRIRWRSSQRLTSLSSLFSTLESSPYSSIRILDLRWFSFKDISSFINIVTATMSFISHVTSKLFLQKQETVILHNITISRMSSCFKYHQYKYQCPIPMSPCCNMLFLQKRDTVIKELAVLPESEHLKRPTKLDSVGWFFLRRGQSWTIKSWLFSKKKPKLDNKWLIVF